jgi:hypothetical protein
VAKDVFDWEPERFRADMRVQGLTFYARAVWREMLDTMHLDGRTGELTGSVEQLSRMCHCPEAEVQRFLDENVSLNVADVILSNGCVTVVNRSMSRAHLARVKAKERQDKYRGKEVSNGSVTGVASSNGPDYTEDFETFWREYPRKVGKQAAFKCWNTRLKEGVDPDLLIRCAQGYTDDCNAEKREDRFIKHAATFLGADRHYEDYADTTGVEEDEEYQRRVQAILKRAP